MMKKLIAILAVLVVFLAGAVTGIYLGGENTPLPSLGSIGTGQEYTATSTHYGVGITAHKLIRGGWGSLGQVTVTGAGTSAFSLIDATSTESLATDTRFSTTTQLLATIPASLAAGTYVFDLTYTKGLFIYFDVVGTAPTTTITYR